MENRVNYEIVVLQIEGKKRCNWKDIELEMEFLL